MQELEKEFDLKAKNLKLERDREIEEYNYKIKRDREIANNKWEDEKEQREKELEEKEKTINQLLEEAETNDKYLKELEEKVNSIPKLLETEYIKGRKDATNELEKNNRFEVELLKRDFQNTIDRQNDKLVYLQEEINKVYTEKESLQKKLEQAYIQIKDMATKTVEATGGVKILGNNNETNK